MSVLLAVDDELAETLRGLLPGDVTPHQPDLAHMPFTSLAEEGPRALAYDVAHKNPQVLVAGVRLGGNAYCGMDGVRLVLQAPKPPAVVVLTPLVTPELAKHGREIGVYDFVATRGRSIADLVERVTKAVVFASAWRDGFSSSTSLGLRSRARKPPSRKPRRGRS